MLFLLFLVIPVVEVILFVAVGDAIGILPTAVMVVATALLGAGLVKRQGIATWARARGRLEGGQLPGDELAHGAMILVSGALLLTPGFLTDAIGFALLVPALREVIKRQLVNRYGGRVITL